MHSSSERRLNTRILTFPFLIVGILALISFGNLILVGTASAAENTDAAESNDTTESNDAADELHRLLDDTWEFQMREFPLFATSVGDARYNDKLPDLSPESLKGRAEFWNQALARAEVIDPESLRAQDRISLEMFIQTVKWSLEEIELGLHEMPITTDNGFHIEFAFLPKDAPLRSETDFEHYIARLEAFPRLVEQNIYWMRQGLAKGKTLPAVVLKGVDGMTSSHVVEKAEDSVFFAPFLDFPSTVPPKAHERLREQGRRAVLESVVPGYRAFANFMKDEYVPGARQTLGASELPNGDAYYAQRIRYFTTLDLGAEEIHQIGLQEVKRIRAEMEAIIEKVEFEGSFADFLNFLRTDPRFYAETPEELLREASFIAKRMDAQLPSLFKTLPRQPYGVEPVPDHLAPTYTTGRYVPAPIDGTQPGYYWVNTYNLKSRPLYVLAALSLHEAVPGHHLQIALTQELDDLPPFRRALYLSAFGEGWGLYSEWLGLEAGIYDDPYSDFGRLTYEMWRACRLVVDTGLHAKGWSRQQAIDYLAENTALSIHEVTTETDRYISWPAQALAYKLGELKIRGLRKEAEEALGERFDVREFHDVVLANGTVPLTVLERLVRDYIAAQSKTAGP